MSYSDLIINDVDTDMNSTKFYFEGTDRYLELYPRGDCCSRAYVLFPNGFNKEKMIGKKISEITHYCGDCQNENDDENEDVSDMYKRKYDTTQCYDEEEERFTEYTIVFSDYTTQEFLLYGVSNGYYRAFLNITLEGEDKISGPVFTGKITFVIGLPGSGKSWYTRQNFKNVKCYDDFFDNVTVSSINTWMENNPTKDIVLSEPRFTNPKTFKYFLKSFYNITGCDVNVVLFENNFSACRENLIEREHNVKLYINSLNSLKYKYNLDDPVYTQFPRIVVPVYKY